MSLLEIANKVIANDEIGSVPVYAADAQWFVNQFQEVISLHPEAKAWDEGNPVIITGYFVTPYHHFGHYRRKLWIWR